MTITLLAPDGVAVTAQQERQARAAMYAGSPSRPLGGRSGFRPGTAADTLTATSATWTLKPCAAMIDPGATTHQGMYGWSSDANITGSVIAADATNPRVDIVYVQINDSTSGDGSGAVSYAPQYLAGVPASTPVSPWDTGARPSRSFLLGTISVPKAGGGSPTATVNPQYFVAAGGVLPVGSTAERDALAAYDGLVIERMDITGRPLERYDGTVWWRSGGPHATAAGRGNIGVVAGNTLFGPSFQAFPAGRFTVAPVVTVTTDQSRIISVPGGITKDGFNLYLQNVTSTASNNGVFSWTAVQQTPTSATG